MDLKGAEIRSFFELVAGERSKNPTQRYIIKIPHYQRPYRWGEELIDNLVQDWAQANSAYFAGSIVTVVREGKREFELIDGQQRFTTIYLANYLRFLFYRVMAKECCTSKKFSRSHDDVLHRLIETESYLLGSSNKLNEYLAKIEEVAAQEDASDDDNEKYFLEYACFPSMCGENDEDYLKNHYQLLKAYLKGSNLILSYDRSFFNEVLLEVLSSACIKITERKEPELIFYHLDDRILEGGGAAYKQAIQTLFDAFCEIYKEENANSNNLNAFYFARGCAEKINDFLTQIQICAIETTNPDDAYTLFETLNERSLALDNLDLIKNQLYKTFVESNKKLSDIEKDQSIEFLDKIWNDEIFKDTGIQQKGLITFLAVTYITGDTSITPKQADKRMRGALKTYLTKYNEGNPYTYDLALADFNVFKACRTILDEAGVRYQSIPKVACEVFYGPGTILKKCIHFIRGAGQDTVLAGLFAVILNYIRLKESVADLDNSKVKSYAKDYLNTSLPPELQEMAYDLWKASMQSNSYTKALNHSWDLLTSNNLSSTSFKALSLPAHIDNELKQEFNDWLQTWSYGRKKQSYKIRILFARCLQLTEDQSGLLKNACNLTIPLNSEDIDHMEPTKIDVNNAESYFQDDDREAIINQLGNMMILPASNNRRKSNSPMQSVFNAFASTNLSGHFLIKKTEELLNSNHNKGPNGVKVPTKEFFTERKKYLIQTFSKAMSTPFN